MTRVTIGIGAALAAIALVPAAALGDGLPVPVDDAGPSGVVSVDGGSRYVTVPARGGTIVERVDTTGGRIAGSTFLRGTFTIPVVALDGSPAGLSHDGRTLVLIRPRSAFPRARTTFAIVDASRMRTRRLITLRGDFSFDAISPDGATAYLVNYIAPNDPTRYRVRALDAVFGNLAARPVVDPHERGDAMRGYALTRATSPDGRWHYTLYDGAGKTPFVHALDTQARRAKCIDLPGFAPGADLSDLGLRASADGGTLLIGPRGQETMLTVDTRSFRVTKVNHRAAPARQASAAGAQSSDVPWFAGLALLLASAGLAVTLRRRRGRRRAATAA
jgi:hypothetical protein